MKWTIVYEYNGKFFRNTFRGSKADILAEADAKGITILTIVKEY